jgi:hypothetical protein
VLRRRRVRRPFGAREPVGTKDIIEHPRIPEFNRQHHDSPLTSRGRVILYSMLAPIAVALALLVLLTR